MTDQPNAPAVDKSWTVPCPEYRCGAPAGEACLRLDGTRSTVSHGGRWRAYDRAQQAHAKSAPAPTTDVPDYIAGARALLAASDCTINGAPAVVVRVAELNDLVGRVHRAEAAARTAPDSPVASGGTADNPAVAAPATADDGLRERVAAAIDQLHDTGGIYAIEDAERYRVADAVMAVRDRRMEQLTAGRDTWRAKAEEIERDRDRLAEELAARIASQRRVASEQDKALKAFNAVTLELWDAQSDRDIAESARAQAEKRIGIVERLNRNQADTIRRVRDLTGRWAKRTDQLKRAAELLDDALAGPEADRA